MAPRRGAAVEEEEPEQDGDLVSLQFDDALTWRPGKPIPTDQLLKRLTKLYKELEQMEQETTDANSFNKVAKEVASHPLLTHKDKGVRALTACCVVEILRLCAPNAPFTESQLKVGDRKAALGLSESSLTKSLWRIGHLQSLRQLHHPCTF